MYYSNYLHFKIQEGFHSKMMEQFHKKRKHYTVNEWKNYESNKPNSLIYQNLGWLNVPCFEGLLHFLWVDCWVVDKERATIYNILLSSWLEIMGGTSKIFL